MKKIYTRALPLMLMGGIVATAIAEPVKVGDIYYEITGDNTVKVMPDRSGGVNTNSYKGTLTIPATVTINGKKYTVNEIGARSFQSAYSLQSVTLPNTIVRLDSLCFASYRGTSLELPASVRVIEDEAFAFAQLTHLGIQEGLDSVGFGGLGYLNSMSETLKLPASLRKMAPGALGYSHKMEAFEVDAANPYWKSVDGVVFSNDGKTLFAYPCYKFVEGSYEIPEGVEYIEENAASNLDRQTGIKFSNTPVILGQSAFESSTKIVTLLNTGKIKSIGKEAFAGCSHLESFPSTASLEVVDSAAFRGVAAYGELPFTINFDDAQNLTTIGELAFAQAVMSNVTLPGSLENLSCNAFRDTKISEINVAPENQKYLSRSGCVFTKDMQTLLTVPSLFVGTEYAGPTEVRANADGEAYYEYTVPSEVKDIGDEAFYGCSKINKINFPEGIQSWGKNAFYRSGLMEVTIPASITTLPYEAFGGSKLLKVNVPSTVAAMEGGVFSNCASLATATLPDNLEEIAPGTFWANGKLTAVNIPQECKTIGYNSFSNCYLLTEVDIPDKVETIGYNAFRCNWSPYNQGKMEKVTLGSKVGNIETGAFYGQLNISSITSMNTVPPTMEEDTFSPGVYTKATVTVPDTSLEAYKADPVWGKFQNWDTVTVTGIEGLESEDITTSSIYYDLSGRRVENPVKGIYIERRGSKTKKVIVM